MSVESIYEEEILELVTSAWYLLNPEQRKFLDNIKIVPEKWTEQSADQEIEDFWVVAVFQQQVIWYNEIEAGFSKTEFKRYGCIPRYESQCATLDILLEKMHMGIE